MYINYTLMKEGREIDFLERRVIFMLQLRYLGFHLFGLFFSDTDMSTL